MENIDPMIPYNSPMINYRKGSRETEEDERIEMAAVKCEINGKQAILEKNLRHSFHQDRPMKNSECPMLR